ncbi:DUF6493 family protein [Kitasatospora cineracea]|uniref:DUF7824 domain-containing protein n=1 Tax=Kitasatospora cineracea TaxID=88074 RepID=A0A8G1X886_9ACTN|nr:DUF6493 family protein [Kitasatospora cineracea]ROR37502.1 hypothetical protein EDD39_5650 [Kitasatospora cineracea]
MSVESAEPALPAELAAPAGSAMPADFAEELAAAVREARFADVADLVTALPDARRRAALPRLRRLRRELRDSSHSRGGATTALLVAGAVCHTAPSGAADWIGGREFDVRYWAQPPLVALLDDRPAPWQREVALRLARRPADRTGWGSTVPYEIAEHLLRRSDTPPPAEPDFVAGWMRDRGRPEPRPWLRLLPPGPDLYARLSADAFAPVLAPLVFDADTAAHLSGPWSAGGPAQRWPAVLARLAAEGTVDRTALLGRGFARLVRGGAPGELRTYLEALRALAPGPDELADNRRALLALLDGPSTVAGYAQEALAALDGAGRLAAEEVAEASGVLLARPEKKLVRAQLGWLERVAADGRAELALRAAADCLGHPDRQLQGQALKLLKRHVASAEGELLTELRAAALLLDPAHARTAAELLGVDVPPLAAAQDADRLPEPPRRVPVPAPLATPAEVAEELAAALAAPEESVSFERVLDGLARQVWADRDALAAALAPVLPADEWRTLGGLAGAATGAVPRSRVLRALQSRADRLFRGWGFRGPVGEFLAARLHETAWRLAADPVPFLLSTPTWRNGALDARELAARLARYEQLGVRPGPVDFALALLRTAGDGTEDTRALTSPAGRQLAAWLRGGGLPRRDCVPVPAGTWTTGVRCAEFRRYAEQPEPAGPALELLTLPALDVPGVEPAAGPPAAVRALLGPSRDFQLGPAVTDSLPDSRWTALLPHHREELALRITGQLAESAADTPERGHPQLLPLLAEAEGPCGFAVHQALAYGLGAGHAEDRSATVDALLSLAAQRQLDPAALAAEVHELLVLGAVKPNRLAATLAELADPAPRLTWSVLAPLLPALLDGGPPRGAADLVAVAVDCARRSGARGPIDAVTRTAARKGGTKLLAEARNLAALLGPA